MPTIEALSRYRGCLLGLAAGDALGTAVEFRPPGTFPEVTDMTGGGAFGLQPGQWTDDTSMALCLAESLVECRGFDPRDQMERYLRWYHQGYLSSTGECFDIGGTVAYALHQYERTRQPYSGSTAENTAGNGSLMRLAPVPMAYARIAAEALDSCAQSSRTTHGAPAALDACRYYGGLIVGALNGVSKEILLAPRYSPMPGAWEEQPLAPAVEAVAAGSYQHKQPPEIAGTGYVVKSMEAALWAFYHSTDFHDGCLLAANLGNDADTTAAIYGQLAGAYYGEQGIPAEWHSRLALRERIEALAEGLFHLLD